MDQNMTATSLDLMHDISIPPAVSFWPPAPGWYALFLLAVTYGFYLGFKYWSRYQKNLYRREALKVLDALDEEDMHKEISTLLGLMKRVGLQHFGREKVAALSNDTWWDFMEKHSKAKVSIDVREISKKILYNPTAKATPEDVKAVSKVAKIWITTHQGEEND